MRKIFKIPAAPRRQRGTRCHTFSAMDLMPFEWALMIGAVLVGCVGVLMWWLSRR